jgi:large subunit ribosomal protein L25
MSYELLNAKTRKETGKTANNNLRAEGRTPAILYGQETKEKNLSIDTKELRQLLGTEHRIVNLKFGKSEEIALIKEVQYHPVKDKVLHIDFLAIKPNKKFKAEVPVRVINETKSPGVKMGGKIHQNTHKLKVESTLENLPEHIDIDVIKLGNSQSLLIKDIVMNENVKILNPSNLAVVSISKAKS